jgi:hypothetical protein
LRWVRVGIIGAVAAGIVLAIIAGPSFAAHLTGQASGSGYGAPQVLGEQFIKPKSSSSSNVGFWVGLLLALGILGATGFIGWRRTQTDGIGA